MPEAARAAEAAGYDGLLTMENKHDPFLPHALAGGGDRAGGTRHVSRDRVPPRSPMVTANVCWDLQVASRGRFVLGIGPQIPAAQTSGGSACRGRRRCPPAARYVQALRAIWTTWQTGERLRFEGTHYTFTLMTPHFVPAVDRHADGAGDARGGRAAFAAPGGRGGGTEYGCTRSVRAAIWRRR
ncbi:MAG: LLM class flavin-dependent oxidoreductase [Acetobacteraceae bacterium]